MATFVHLALESDLKAIRANGIAPGRSSGKERGVFASPVTADFQASHQWLRELRRRQGGRLAAVYFRIPDDEDVLAGRYNAGHEQMTAVEAIASAMKDAPVGFEVIIGRRIFPKEILQVKALPQIIGWRFYPEAKGAKPFCGCPYCQKGNIKGQKLIRRWEEGQL